MGGRLGRVCPLRGPGGNGPLTTYPQGRLTPHASSTCSLLGPKPNGQVPTDMRLDTCPPGNREGNPEAR